MILTQLFETALRDKEDLQAKRKALQDLSMNKDVDQKAVGQRKLDLEKEAKRRGLAENAERLNVGDPVEITGNVEFNGATGEIAGFGQDNRFVIVDLYNHGRHSFHSSDVGYNDYADAQDEEDDWYDDQEDTMEGFQDFNKVEPYAVCLAGKPVKKFDYYEDARRFHDNWKKKLYNQGEQAKADKITLLPLNLDEGFMEPKGGKLNQLITDYANTIRDAWENADYGNDEEADYLYDQASEILGTITANYGDKAAAHAEKAGQSNTFGREGNTHGHGEPDRLAGGLRQGKSQNTTNAGKIPKNTQNAMKNDIKIWGPRINGPQGALPEAISKNDLLGNVAKDLNTQFKKAKSGKLKASGDFTKGDHWQGAKPGDYGYTGYQGHGMPKDNPKKKKGVAEGTSPQSKLDQKIIHLLTNGIPADAIARKLDIPVEWVDEVAEYNIPDSAIDYNDPRNTPPTNRFGEGQTDYSKRRQRERDVDAGKPVARQRQSKMTDYQKRRAQDKKDMELGETKSLAKRVRVVKTGETGTIRQVKLGAYKGAPKTYYVDLDNGGQADNLPASALRLLKDQTVEATEKTTTGLRHRAEPGVYGGAEREEDPLRTLDKPGTNKIEKALGVKFDREKKYQGGVALKEQSSPVESAILHRIMVAHSDILAKYGPQAVMDAANDTADFVGDVDEIGSSDVSAWVKQTIQILDSNHQVDEVSKSTLGRYVKLAGIDATDRASSSSYKSGAAGDKYNKADASRQEHNRERGIDRAITRLTR